MASVIAALVSRSTATHLCPTTGPPASVSVVGRQIIRYAAHSGRVGLASELTARGAMMNQELHDIRLFFV